MNAPPDQLAFHVRSYVPDADGEELELRATLLKARDHAAGLRAISVSAMSQAHAADAHDVVGRFVFKPDATNVQLKAAIDYCRAVCKAAMLAEIIDPEWL